MSTVRNTYDREASRRKVAPRTSLVKEWAAVASPGTDDECVASEHWTYADALKVVELSRGGPERWDVMRRGADGVLTTEF